LQELLPGHGAGRCGGEQQTNHHHSPDCRSRSFSGDVVQSMPEIFVEALGMVRTFGADTLDYDRYRSAKDFDRGPYNML
jgi:hypothetical protein